MDGTLTAWVEAVVNFFNFFAELANGNTLGRQAQACNCRF
jgi:hypothetical protein